MRVSVMDTCRTASDVCSAALRVHRTRQAAFWRPVHVELLPPPPPPPAPHHPVIPYPHRPIVNSVNNVLRLCSEYYGISIVDLKSGRRTKDVMRPRQMVMYAARMLTERSLPHIGRCLSDRDHTTILSGIRKIQSLIDAGGEIGERLKADYEAIKATFTGEGPAVVFVDEGGGP